MKISVLIGLAALALTVMVGCDADQVMQSKGGETYQVDLVWGIKGTDNGEFRVPQGVAINSAGNVYVVDMGNARVQVFDPNGNFITAFGNFTAPDPNAPDNLQRPMGIAIDPSDNVWVSDNDPGGLPGSLGDYSNRIVEYSSDGTFIASYGHYGGFGSPAGLFNGPNGLAFDSFGTLYVCDTFNNRLQTFDPVTMVWTLHGSQGTQPGLFAQPRDIAIDSTNNIIVADTYNYRIQKLDNNWTPLLTYGQVGHPGTGIDSFNEPSAIDTDNNDFVYVMDTFNYRVVKLDQSFNYVCIFGSPEGTGAQSSVGTMNLCFGLAVNNDGKVYVSDTFMERITRYVHI